MSTPTLAEQMQALIDMISPVITLVFNTATTCINKIVSTPYLLFTTGFLVVGGAIKIVRSLLRR